MSKHSKLIELEHLIENNKNWVNKINSKEPNFFTKLAKQQKPEILWIGCSDSRVPANQIVGLLPGELFVHRNVANMVVKSDSNCNAVVQFAVNALKVKHIIICGHYNCGGVQSALEGNNNLSFLKQWVDNIVDVKEKHSEFLSTLNDAEKRLESLCELNVLEQVLNICSSETILDAWKNNQELAIHGWIYDIADGLLKDLGMCVTNPDELDEAYMESIKAICSNS